MDIKVLPIILSIMLPFSLYAADTLDLDNDTLEILDDGGVMEFGDDADTMELLDESLGSVEELLSDATDDDFNEAGGGLSFEGKAALEFTRFYQTGLSPDQDYHNN